MSKVTWFQVGVQEKVLICESVAANMAELLPLFPQIGLMCLTLCSRG